MMEYTQTDDRIFDAVIRCLSKRTGRANCISRDNLVNQVRYYGMQVHERQVREAIKQLRRAGHLICSAAGEGGGYYMAGSKQEYSEFRQAEFAAKISDMSETMRAMDQTAQKDFGSAIQLGIF